MKPLRVLSLFDGISCGQVALERAGIPVEIYYASEIDKYAIQITQKNYPNTIQLGDVTKIDFTQFIGKVDLIMGGSPCQDLSIAGKRAGLQGERSGLFYKFVEAIEVIKPKYFLLENNYGMPREAYEEMSRLIGCYPIMINSALVSAQTRKRFYWTNIGPQDYNLFGFPTVAIPQPENKGILLKDVLENSDPGAKILRFTRTELGKKLRKEYENHTIHHGYNEHRILQPRPDFLSNTLTTKDKDNILVSPMRIPENTVKGYAEIEQGECMDLTHLNSKTRRGRAMKDKCNCLQTQSEFFQYLEPICLNSKEGRKDGKSKQPSLQNRIYSVKGKSVTMSQFQSNYKIDLPDGEYLIRKLTPLECERLQTLPDNYTEGVSNTQRYKAIGNGWTVDVIAHIFSFLEGECGKQ